VLVAPKPIHKDVEVTMIRNNQKGQMLVSAALSLVLLLGFAGLGIDMGVLRYQRRLQQTAADGAAVAGASNLAYGGIQTGAQDAATANGFSDTSTGSGCPGAIGCVTITVNHPPLSGPHSGAAQYVEVIVNKVQPTYFMKIFGVQSENITARAVATNVSGGTNSGCLYTLGAPSSSIENVGVVINGNPTLNAKTCGIVDNGNFNTKGSSLTVTAGTFGMAGDPNRTGNGGTVTCIQSPGSCPTPNMPASGDPFAYLTPPCTVCATGTAITIDGNGNFSGSGVTYASNPNGKGGVYTISQGTYSSISISGTGSGNTVVFSPGLYIIDGAGGITIPGNATISGPADTFYFTNGATWNSTGNPSVNLTAPGTTGQYPGILFYQDPTDLAAPTIGGDGSSQYNGVLYFPKVGVTFYGNSNTTVSVALVVADSLSLSGNPTVNLQGSAGLPPGVSLITHAILVE
jgi:hypothetical protein